MAAWPGSGNLRDWEEYQRDWVQSNDACRRDILARLELSGPQLSRDFPDTCEVAWKSSGWTNNQNVRKLLDFMVARGEIAVAGRRGRDPVWDLASRIYPDDPVVPEDEAIRTRNELRLHALGIARAKAVASPGETNDVGQTGEEARVEGVKGIWRLDPVYLGLSFEGRTALLSPLDRLVFDRKRLLEIFDFDYQLEMYKPAAKRRWGYWAMPILHGDRLVGKLDATADRKAGVFRVDAIHQDVAFDKTMTDAVDHEIDDLAGWLDLERVDAAARW
jgi:uncharacterized protein YcaQ